MPSLRGSRISGKGIDQLKPMMIKEVAEEIGASFHGQPGGCQ
jgi:hypothetical protein